MIFDKDLTNINNDYMVITNHTRKKIIQSEKLRISHKEGSQGYCEFQDKKIVNRTRNGKEELASKKFWRFFGNLLAPRR